MGDVEGVQRNTKKKRKKETNQKISNSSFGKVYSLLEYKLKAKGITVKKVACSGDTQGYMFTLNTHDSPLTHSHACLQISGFQYILMLSDS